MKLVLLRHGESVWNKENRFTGWTDVDLSETGIFEASQAGDALLTNGFDFDVNIPTGIPLVYEFSENFAVIHKYYLADENTIKAKMDNVANQGKVK